MGLRLAPDLRVVGFTRESGQLLPAESSRLIRIGDRILSVNGRPPPRTQSGSSGPGLEAVGRWLASEAARSTQLIRLRPADAEFACAESVNSGTGRRSLASRPPLTIRPPRRRLAWTSQRAHPLDRSVVLNGAESLGVRLAPDLTIVGFGSALGRKETPLAASSETPGQSRGAEVMPAGGKAERSQAARARVIGVGDRIVGVDGRSLEGLPPAAARVVLRAAFQDTPREQLRCRELRTGAEAAGGARVDTGPDRAGENGSGWSGASPHCAVVRVPVPFKPRLLTVRPPGLFVRRQLGAGIAPEEDHPAFDGGGVYSDHASREKKGGEGNESHGTGTRGLAGSDARGAMEVDSTDGMHPQPSQEAVGDLGKPSVVCGPRGCAFEAPAPVLRLLRRRDAYWWRPEVGRQQQPHLQPSVAGETGGVPSSRPHPAQPSTPGTRGPGKPPPRGELVVPVEPALFGGRFLCGVRPIVLLDPIDACEPIAGIEVTGRGGRGPQANASVLADEGPESPTGTALPASNGGGNLTTSAQAWRAHPARARGSIALASRGRCFFSRKAQHAQEAGALALVVLNGQEEPLIRMPAPGAAHGGMPPIHAAVGMADYAPGVELTRLLRSSKPRSFLASFGSHEDPALDVCAPSNQRSSMARSRALAEAERRAAVAEGREEEAAGMGGAPAVRVVRRRYGAPHPDSAAGFAAGSDDLEVGMERLALERVERARGGTGGAAAASSGGAGDRASESHQAAAKLLGAVMRMRASARGGQDGSLPPTEGSQTATGTAREVAFAPGAPGAPIGPDGETGSA